MSWRWHEKCGANSLSSFFEEEEEDDDDVMTMLMYMGVIVITIRCFSFGLVG